MEIESYPLEVRFVRYLLENRDGDEIDNLRQIAGAIRCSYRQLLRVVKKLCDNGWIKHLDQKGKYRIMVRGALEQMLS